MQVAKKGVALNTAFPGYRCGWLSVFCVGGDWRVGDACIFPSSLPCDGLILFIARSHALPTDTTFIATQQGRDPAARTAGREGQRRHGS